MASSFQRQVCPQDAVNPMRCCSCGCGRTACGPLCLELVDLGASWQGPYRPSSRTGSVHPAPCPSARPCGIRSFLRQMVLAVWTDHMSLTRSPAEWASKPCCLSRVRPVRGTKLPTSYSEGDNATDRTGCLEPCDPGLLNLSLNGEQRTTPWHPSP